MAVVDTLPASRAKAMGPCAYQMATDKEANIKDISRYWPDQTAGIDSAGLLAGSLAMAADLDGVADALNRSLGRMIDAYSALGYPAGQTARAVVRVDGNSTGANALGLDPSGTPAFPYASSSSSRIRTTGATYTWSDIERNTVLIPDISLLQNGDLIVGRDEKGRVHLGIVTNIRWKEDNAPKPAFGSDATLWYTQVEVVSVRRGLRVVTLGSWGNPATVFGGFTQESERYQMRRLVAFNGGALATATPGKEGWEAFDEDVTDATVNLEFARAPDGWAERWIPNTGEWLTLQNVRVRGRSVFGEGALPDGTRARIIAPLDAYADPTETDPASNVKNNRGSGIEIGYADGATHTWLAKATLNTASGGYTMKYNQTYFNTDGSAKSNAGTTILKVQNGTLLFRGKKLAVRPLGGAIRPGDDFLLRFAIELPASGDGAELVTATAGIEDRIAIYDKKLLWRANLYIDEGVEDWNDLHPWNAPPDAAAYAAMSQADKGKINWWSESWGYNEWNRKFDITTTFNNQARIGLKNLSPGDCKQTIRFPEFTPVRTINGETDAPGSLNAISGTVAYSYPLHRYEQPSGWSNARLAMVDDTVADEPSFTSSFGDNGSMDSPFDYVWKIKRQIAAQNTSTVTAGRASGNEWYNYVVTMPTGTISTSASNDSLFTKPDSTPRYLDIKYIPSLGLYFRDPKHTWVEEPGEDADAIDTAATAGWQSSPYAAAHMDSAQKRRSASWIIEAGTDCIGFAQRVASWRFGAGQENSYIWNKLPPGMMEYGNELAGNENPYTVMSVTNNRAYPVPGSQETAATTIIHKGIAHTSQEEKTAFLEMLKKVIPGDIWVKDSTSSNDGQWREHIAIVASIPNNPDEINDIDTYMGQMILIEGEYGDRIQSVIKKLSVGNYNQGSIPLSFQIYPIYTTPDTGNPVSLNCQSWAIRI